MRKCDAIEYFGSQAALARALDIKPQSINDWGDEVPALRQLQLEAITAGGLPASPGLIPRPCERMAS